MPVKLYWDVPPAPRSQDTEWFFKQDTGEIVAKVAKQHDGSWSVEILDATVALMTTSRPVFTQPWLAKDWTLEQFKRAYSAEDDDE